MLIYAENVFSNKRWSWKIKNHYITNIIHSKEQLVSEYLQNVCTMQNIFTMQNICKNIQVICSLDYAVQSIENTTYRDFQNLTNSRKILFKKRHGKFFNKF